MSRSDRIMLATGGSALVLAIAAGWVMFAPVTDAELSSDPAGLVVGTPGAPASVSPPPSVPASGTIVVDVEGAVAQPGIRELVAGSRVADAIAAAGGYAADVDLAATAAGINLAETLSDGQQLRVPRIGEGGASASAQGQPDGDGTAVGGTGGGGLINLNSATPEQLEALPGIGPVTVQKIVAARQQQPFASLDDAVQRGILNRGQLEDIQGLATAG